MRFRRIRKHPQVTGGEPSIRDTGISVATVVDMVADGKAEADILGVYPKLEREDIREALRYAAYVVRGGRAWTRERLAEECAKLDPGEERALAEEGLCADTEAWPEY